MLFHQVECSSAPRGSWRVTSVPDAVRTNAIREMTDVPAARADDFSRGSGRKTALLFGTHGHQPPFVQPLMKHRVVARGVAAVVTDFRAQEAGAAPTIFSDGDQSRRARTDGSRHATMHGGRHPVIFRIDTYRVTLRPTAVALRSPCTLTRRNYPTRYPTSSFQLTLVTMNPRRALIVVVLLGAVTLAWLAARYDGATSAVLTQLPPNRLPCASSETRPRCRIFRCAISTAVRSRRRRCAAKSR